MEVKSSERSPVTLEHAKHAVGECLPEAIEVDLCVALVQSKEERSVRHLAFDSVLCVGSVGCVEVCMWSAQCVGCAWGVCDL